MNDETDNTSTDNQEDAQSTETQSGEQPVDESHREAIGKAVTQAQSQGLDMGNLAQQLGLSTDDVTSMTHGDLLSVAKHLATEHPEIAQSLLSRIPIIGGLLSSLGGLGNLGGLGGLLGGNK